MLSARANGPAEGGQSRMPGVRKAGPRRMKNLKIPESVLLNILLSPTYSWARHTLLSNSRFLHRGRKGRKLPADPSRTFPQLLGKLLFPMMQTSAQRAISREASPDVPDRKPATSRLPSTTSLVCSPHGTFTLCNSSLELSGLSVSISRT